MTWQIKKLRRNLLIWLKISSKSIQILQMTVGFLTDYDFKTMVTTGLLKNFPVTSDDIEVTHRIYGSSVVGLKGKTAWNKPKRSK